MPDVPPPRGPVRLKRRWLYLPFAVAAVIVTAYYGLWRAGAAEMEKAIAAWAREQRAAGVAVEYAALRRDGFPFFLRIHIDEPSVTSPSGYRWRGERLSLDALPYEMNKVIAWPLGEQTVTLPNAEEWRVSAGDLRVSLATDKARGWVMSASAGGVRARRATDKAEAAVDSLVFDLAPSAEEPTTLVLSLAGEGASYADGREGGPDQGAPGDGNGDGISDGNGGAIDINRVQTVTLLTRSDALQGEASARRWRDAGGALVVNGLIAEVNGAALTLAGEVTLDAAFYPAGALRAELSRPAGLGGLLRRTGALTPQEADAAAAGLAMMALASGGKIVAPVELNNGSAAIRGVKIADLPRIR